MGKSRAAVVLERAKERIGVSNIAGPIEVTTRFGSARKPTGAIVAQVKTGGLEIPAIVDQIRSAGYAVQDRVAQGEGGGGAKVPVVNDAGVRSLVAAECAIKQG